MPHKTIVVGVDRSETAAAAARKAAELASALGGRLHVVSAYGRYEAETVGVGSDTFVLSTAKDAEVVAEDVAATLRSDHPGLEITSGAAQGKPGDGVVAAADHLDAELIVVGNKRVQGVARVLGSIASHVAAHASCDVYIAHTHSR